MAPLKWSNHLHTISTLRGIKPELPRSIRSYALVAAIPTQQHYYKNLQATINPCHLHLIQLLLLLVTDYDWSLSLTAQCHPSGKFCIFCSILDGSEDSKEIPFAI